MSGRARGRPNIVFVFSDQHRARTTGYRGARVHTPVMDRMAAEGVVFDMASRVSDRPVPTDQRAVSERPAAAGRPAHARHHPRRRRLRHRVHRQVAPGRQPAGGVYPARSAAAGVSVLGSGQLHPRLHQLALLPRHPGAPALGRLRCRGADLDGGRLNRYSRVRSIAVRAGAVVGAAAQPLPRPAAAERGDRFLPAADYREQYGPAVDDRGAIPYTD